MSPKKAPVITNAGTLAALRAGACNTLGIPDHPDTVKSTVIQAPRTGQYYITLVEITRGPVRVHVCTVDDSGNVIRHRYNSR